MIALEALLRLWSNLPTSRMTLHDQLALAEAQQPGRFFGRCERDAAARGRRGLYARRQGRRSAGGGLSRAKAQRVHVALPRAAVRRMSGRTFSLSSFFPSRSPPDSLSPRDHHFGRLHDRHRVVTPPQLEGANGVGCDDRRQHLTADAKA